MKKIWLLSVCFLLTAVSCAMISGRTGQRPEGICTRDINAWGNASSCSCEEGDYDERSGLCLVGEGAMTVLAQGKVTAGIMAVGGETTGFVIETQEGDLYELILKTTDKKKLGEHDGLWFEIEGELITVQFPERGERRMIIAEKITYLE